MHTIDFGTNEGRCISCKFWENYACHNNNSIVYDFSDEEPVDKLVYWDRECWSASHQCGPFFGCVHWSQRHDYEIY